VRGGEGKLFCRLGDCLSAAIVLVGRTQANFHGISREKSIGLIETYSHIGGIGSPITSSRRDLMKVARTNCREMRENVSVPPGTIEIFAF
jgi:hypothetical protein